MMQILSSPFTNSSRRASSDYMLLEPSRSHDSGFRPRARNTLHDRRYLTRCPSYTRFCAYTTSLLFLTVPILLVGLLALKNGVPPLYTEIRQFERELSMKNAPIGSSAKFIRFPGRFQGLGMNNYLQELYFMAYLAYLANRTFVYDDYVWSRNPTPYTLRGFSIIPSRLPLHAFLSGPESGNILSQNNMSTDVHSPKAIDAEWYKTICPPSEIVVINPPGAPESGDGLELLEFWTDLLSRMTERCVEVDERRQPLFHPDLYDSHRLFSAWPGMRDSPILKGTSWSPLVFGALSRNLPLVISPTTMSLNATIPHLLAMHVRRGDFEAHCRYLARMDKEYQWILQHPQLPDRFSPESVGVGDRLDYYRKHCWVEVRDIVRRAHELRTMSISESNTPLRSVYIMTNGGADWVQSVKKALFEDGWEDVKTTKDLILDKWERYIDGAIDMGIAERAGVFIGNGFSSLTSNVVMFRILSGRPIESNRFW